MSGILSSYIHEFQSQSRWNSWKYLKILAVLSYAKWPEFLYESFSIFAFVDKPEEVIYLLLGKPEW